MSGKNILLLGGTGFVGRKLVTWLSQRGHTLSVISRSTRQTPFTPDIAYFSCSLEHRETLRRLLPTTDVVIHLASASTPATSTLDPTFEALHNVMPTARFLEIFAEYPATKLIYLSSGGAIYGDNPNPIVDENQASMPLSYYGAGKASIEALLHAFCHQTGRSATILRPSNFYGPGQPVRPGFGIIPTLISRALNNQTIEIWGDGNTIRDYLHIDDFTLIIEKLINQDSAIPDCKIYNAGTGTGTTVNQLCDLIENLNGRPLQRTYHTIRKVDVKRIVLDNQRIKAALDWEPTIDLLSGLEETWDFMKKEQVNHA